MLQSTIINNSEFYMSGLAGFRDEDKVTNTSTNLDLGIRHINLSNPKSQAQNSPIFKVSVELVNGVVLFGDIFPNKDGKTMNIKWPSERYTDAQGQVAYADKVSVPMAITAQVLRYAHTKVRTVEGVPAVKPAPTPVDTPAPTAPLTSISQEQMEALLAGLVKG